MSPGTKSMQRYLLPPEDTGASRMQPSNGDQEFTGFIPACSINTEHIPLVTVVPLIKRP